MKPLFFSFVFLLPLIFQSGCSTLFPLKKEYSMTQDWNSQHIIEENTQPPTDSAHDLVSSAKTVAFFPPDACRSTKAAGPGASEVSNVMRLNCGVLMSELEAEATQAGFHVVSWQTLRGPERPLDYASRNGVDILFEINELSLDVPTQDIYTVANTSFFENGDSISVYNAEAVAESCRKRYASSAVPPAVVVTLDMKMVSVKDGRIGWYYRKTQAENQNESFTLERTFPAYGAPNYLFDVLGDLSWISGIVGLVSGGTFIALGAILAMPTFYAIGGLGLAVLPIALVSWAGFSTVAHLLASYPEPEAVICQGSAVEDYQVSTYVEPTIRSAHTVRSETTASINKSDVEERRKLLLKTVVSNFMGQLNEMRSTPSSANGPATHKPDPQHTPAAGSSGTSAGAPASEPQIGDVLNGYRIVGFAGEKTLEDGRRITGNCGYLRQVLVEDTKGRASGIVRAEVDVPCQQTNKGLAPAAASLKLVK